MPAESQEATGAQNPYRILLYRVMFFMAALVVARFVLEVAGTPQAIARYLSSTAALFLAAIYMAAVAPLRGSMKKFRQLLVPSLLLSAWTVAWIMLATVVSAVFRLEQSHFAEKEDYGNWGRLGQHLVGHVVELAVFFALVLAIMAAVHILWRWPVTVGPGAMLGALVIIRYWVEAMGVEPWRAAAWSSSVAVIACGFYLGGVGPRLGVVGPRLFLIPALVLGWAWRFWILLAAILSAAIPFYKTHFFDPTGGWVVQRLAMLLAGSVVEGFVAGLILWGIAIWIARATRPATA